MPITTVSAGDVATAAKINEIIDAINSTTTTITTIETAPTGTPSFTLQNAYTDDGQNFRCWVLVTITRKADVGGYVVQYKEATDTAWFILHVAQTTSGNPTINTPYLYENTLYDFRIAYISQLGELSTWSDIQQITTAASSYDLGPPTGLGATPIQGGVILTWNDKGLLGESYNIYVNTVDTFATATLAGTIIGTVFVWWVQTPATEYALHYFWVTTVSRGGTESNPTTSVSATPATAVDSDMAAAAITSAKIADGAVVNTKIAELAVETGKLANLAVDYTKLGANAVIAEKIAAGAIVADKIATNAIVADAIAANAVITDKLAANAVTAAKIAANTITAAEIAAATITATELSSGSVTTEKLAANAVTAAKIAANTITADEIASSAISTDELAALAVTAAKIAAATITADNIASNAITADKINASAVTTDKIDALAVTAAKIAADTITAAKLSADVALLNKIWADTVTGKTLQTAATGTRVVINSGGVNVYGNGIGFYHTDGQGGGGIYSTASAIYVNSTGGMVIQPSGGDLTLSGNTYINIGSDLRPSSDGSANIGYGGRAFNGIVGKTFYADFSYEYYDTHDDLGMLKSYTPKVERINGKNKQVIDRNSIPLLKADDPALNHLWSQNKVIGFLFGCAKKLAEQADTLQDQISSLKKQVQELSER